MQTSLLIPQLKHHTPFQCFFSFFGWDFTESWLLQHSGLRQWRTRLCWGTCWAPESGPGTFPRSTPGPATKQPGQNGGSLTESQNTMCFFFLGQICFGPKFAESHLGWFCWICFSNFGSTLPPQAAKTHWSHSRFGSSESRRNRIPFHATFAPKYIDMSPHLTHV